MSAAKYIPYALVAGGLYALWRMSKGIQAALPAVPAPVNGLGHRWDPVISGFQGVGEYIDMPNYDAVAPRGLHGLRGSAELGSFASVVRKATSQAKEVSKIAAAPIKMMAAPALAVARVAETGSLKQGIQTLKKIAPLSVKALTPNARIMLGKASPVTAAGTPAAMTGNGTTSSAVTWSPIAGRSGWDLAPGEGGTIVFRNQSMNALFSVTPNDMNSLGGPTGVVDYYLSLSGQSATQAPPQAPLVSDPGVGPQTPESASGSGQSFTDPSMYTTASSGGSSDGGYPTAPTTTAATPADTTTPDQQYVAPDAAAAPATGQSISPLAVIGTLVAVPALFMLGGGHK